MSDDRVVSILLVDDNLNNLQLLGDALEEAGLGVRAVTSAAGALRTLDEAPCDLILSDINMPETDGIELCRQLKAQESTADIPVILVTARAATMDKIEAFQAGAVDYVTKPFTPTELLVRVRTQLELRDLRRKLEDQNATLEQNLERLRELEGLRDELVHMVAHDMRSPLSVIAGTLHFLNKRLKPQVPDAEGHLIRLQKAAGMINSMIDNFLDASRLEENHMPITLRRESPRILLESALDDLLSISTEWEIDVRVEDDVSDVRCDRPIIERVLRNLVENALKYASPEAPIGIRARKFRGDVRFEVSDRGPGIPEEHRPHIFERFMVGGAKARKGRSFGLGLAFCKLAIEAHAGTIDVEPNEPHGSTFWFTIPAAGLPTIPPPGMP